MTIRVGEPTGSECLWCDEPVVRRGARGPIPVYCSTDCSQAAHREVERVAAAEERKNAICEWCGKSIPDRGVRVRYCDATCSKARHHAKRMADPRLRERFLEQARKSNRKAREAKKN